LTGADAGKMQRAHLLVFQPILMSLGGARDEKFILV
jgi:hypothetical protein